VGTPGFLRTYSTIPFRRMSGVAGRDRGGSLRHIHTPPTHGLETNRPAYIHPLNSLLSPALPFAIHAGPTISPTLATTETVLVRTTPQRRARPRFATTVGLQLPSDPVLHLRSLAPGALWCREDRRRRWSPEPVASARRPCVRLHLRWSNVTAAQIFEVPEKKNEHEAVAKYQPKHPTQHNRTTLLNGKQDVTIHGFVQPLLQALILPVLGAQAGHAGTHPV
jgi:hypothetical protein